MGGTTPPPAFCLKTPGGPRGIFLAFLHAEMHPILKFSNQILHLTLKPNKMTDGPVGHFCYRWCLGCSKKIQKLPKTGVFGRLGVHHINNTYYYYYHIMHIILCVIPGHWQKFWPQHGRIDGWDRGHSSNSSGFTLNGHLHHTQARRR